MIMPYNVINITYQGQSKKEKKENDNICLVLSRTFVKKVTVGDKELMKLLLINLIRLCCIDLHILPVDLLILLYACTFFSYLV